MEKSLSLAVTAGAWLRAEKLMTNAHPRSEVTTRMFNEDIAALRLMDNDDYLPPRSNEHVHVSVMFTDTGDFDCATVRNDQGDVIEGTWTKVDSNGQHGMGFDSYDGTTRFLVSTPSTKKGA